MEFVMPRWLNIGPGAIYTLWWYPSG